MPMGSTFEIGTQIILLKIDGFLQRLILKYQSITFDVEGAEKFLNGI